MFASCLGDSLSAVQVARVRFNVGEVATREHE